MTLIKCSVQGGLFFVARAHCRQSILYEQIPVLNLPKAE